MFLGRVVGTLLGYQSHRETYKQDKFMEFKEGRNKDFRRVPSRLPWGCEFRICEDQAPLSLQVSNPFSFLCRRQKSA